MSSRIGFALVSAFALSAACHSAPKVAPTPSGTGAAAAPARAPAAPPAAGRGATPPAAGRGATPPAAVPVAAAAPGARGAPGAAGAPARRARLAPDSTAKLRAIQLQTVTTLIAGHENEPAEVVFTNILVLKGITAGQLLKTMDGYGKALSAQCSSCHTLTDWASETSQNKIRARNMETLTQSINSDLMPKFNPANPPKISCMTCHHGNGSPNQSLDAALQKLNADAAAAAAAGGAPPTTPATPPATGGRSGGGGGGGH